MKYMMSKNKTLNTELKEMKYQEDGGTVFSVRNKDGYAKLTRYHVFPGIDLIYNDVNMNHSGIKPGRNQEKVMEIDHCQEGTWECSTGDNYFWLSPGDTSVHRLRENVKEGNFPESHYHGITIKIDLNKCPKTLSCFLEDIDVQPVAMLRKFCPEEHSFFTLRQSPSMAHIFSELYTVPKSVQKGYFKVKVLEILLFLSTLEPKKNQLEQKCISEIKLTLAKKVCDYLIEHIERRITMDELSEHFSVSKRQIKNNFMELYGISPISYIRGQRIRYAADLLSRTDRTVLDIANQFGYENGSKFAGVFREVMGVTPVQYRNDCLVLNRSK